MSARILGETFGLTAQEVNYALKEAGFLSGGPGMYSVTDKGAKFATEEYHKRGTGGYAQYNPSWETRTWDDSVAEELELSDDRKLQIRQAVSDARRAARAARREEAIVAAPRSDVGAVRGGDSDALAKAVAALLAVVATYGIYRAIPHVRKFWVEKAAPGLRNLRDRVQAALNAEESAGADEDSSAHGAEL